MPSKKIPCPQCGMPMSPAASLCRSCKPTYDRTPEHKAKMKETLTGKPKPALRGRRRPGHGDKVRAYWTAERREEARARGKAQAADEEWRLRIANALIGEKNPNWRGGLTDERYAPGFSRTLKAKIRERDHYRCQLCGVTEDELGYRLSVHHADYDKTNHSEENLHSVCKRCNSLANTNREVWEGYFIALSEVRGQFGEDVSKLIGRKIVTQRVGLVATSRDGGPNLAELFGLVPPTTRVG